MKMKLTTFSLITCLGMFTCQAEPSKEAVKNWRTNCLSCHGADGKGETKAGRKSKAKDLTDATYQASFSDDQAFKSIKEGLKKDGKELMKSYGEKLTDEEIKELVAYSRSFKK
jgi:cytochrome c553